MADLLRAEAVVTLNWIVAESRMEGKTRLANPLQNAKRESESESHQLQIRFEQMLRIGRRCVQETIFRQVIVSVQNLVLALLRITSAVWAVLLVFLAPAPSADVAGVCVICGSLFIPELAPSRCRARAEWWVGGTVCLFTALLSISLILTSYKFSYWDTYYAFVAWLIAVAVGVTTARVGSAPQKTLWKMATVMWLWLGEICLLVGAYLQNTRTEFYVGIVIFLALLVLCKAWFRVAHLLIVGINTCILLLISVPLADLVLRRPLRYDPAPDVAGNDYLYSESQEDPRAYSRYARRYAIQYQRLARAVFVPDPNHQLPYLLCKNSEVPFFQSRIRINSEGFRGAQITLSKGRTYRIVALGESTTFGFTLSPDHKPWPEVLADLIRVHLQPGRPFEVINAGAPGYTLEDNLRRMRASILALEPDMMISYHGYNGFPWLYPTLPSVFVKRIPPYKPRPLWLLAELEYRVRLHLFRRSLSAEDIAQIPPVSVLMESRYARAYEDLVSLAKTNGIRLVIANFSMAANASSVPDVKEFYRNSGFPNLYPVIKVNEMHSMLVQEISRRHPEVRFVDTHPQLDGAHVKFTDLIHFDPAGDRQLAATIFGNISNLLHRELSGDRPIPPSP